MMAYKWVSFIAILTILIASILTYNGRGHVYEDSSAWNCETMGNSICGR